MVDQNRDPALDEALELFFYGFRAFTALPDQVLASAVAAGCIIGCCILWAAIRA